MKENFSELPVVVVGAGPIGLAAAAHLAERAVPFLVLEAGSEIANSVSDWGHVRLFTPWSYLLDPASVRLLEARGGWTPPTGTEVPRGQELREQYLIPLAKTPEIAPHLKLEHRVTSVSREGHDRMKDGFRQRSPFVLVVETPQGVQRLRARAVLDASGTWTSPNPLGAGGVEADGELLHRSRIRYGIPDVLGRESSRYLGKRVLVVGSGHSAIGTVLQLTELAEREKSTKVAWAIRRTNPRKLWGGGQADELAERGALGTRVHHAVHSGAVSLLTGLSIVALREQASGLEVVDSLGESRGVFDEIVVAAGSRPDLQMLRELRLEFDTPTEAVKALGPLVDPNHHSCGSVSPHGAEELRHPEENVFIVGMKSYGRAPTFLLRTGYEQVRSVAAYLAGDYEAARNVELTLPKTGVCSTDLGYEEEASGALCC